MTAYNRENVVWTSRIQEAFGPVVELQDEQGKSTYYQVEKEFEVAGHSYVVLRPDGSSKSDEPEILKVVAGADGELSLETIDDDDEWEEVSELYDELTFPE
ncbi:hypothetical protein AWM70_13100 [Paenibacillus yonginensis]|uniref:DUF1292 domain-containing protein n=1 Tax=Paenibacillus yonginensis TaxID=1462996 RepID=A0A1B1N1X3_9BACL|nr:DUF1292 domain-containing protein [Paenibacillus yonginensis]ANS75432.1 hypothetical protein AWM70_13100 [Paenibacillus yonginensis]